MINATSKEMQKARLYAAKINHSCADHAFDSDYGFAGHITDEQKTAYVKDQRRYAKEIESGLHDNNFTVWQRMNYFLTGECVPFLP